MSERSESVTIVGAGIAGAACAVVLHEAGVPFRLVDRGRAVGGRMASPMVHGRRVDIGAGYFTVRDSEFSEIVTRWESAGLARRWTDTFGVLSPGVDPDRTTGPVRWATPNGLRSLVRDLLVDIPSSIEDIHRLPGGDVVLAMPDPQASRIVELADAVEYDPVVTVVCGFDSFELPFTDAAFVNGHPVVEFLADDGARRGDGAAVLVAHTTAAFARTHLDDPASAVGPTVDAVRALTKAAEPRWTHVHRWSFGKPAGTHDVSHRIVERDGRRVGFAGDQWSPTGPPRVESAWRSGTDLGRMLVDLL